MIPCNTGDTSEVVLLLNEISDMKQQGVFTVPSRYSSCGPSTPDHLQRCAVSSRPNCPPDLLCVTLV